MARFKTRTIIGHSNGSSRTFAIVEEQTAGAVLMSRIDMLIEEEVGISEGLMISILPVPHHEQAPA